MQDVLQILPVSTMLPLGQAETRIDIDWMVVGAHSGAVVASALIVDTDSSSEQKKTRQNGKQTKANCIADSHTNIDYHRHQGLVPQMVRIDEPLPTVGPPTGKGHLVE